MPSRFTRPRPLWKGARGGFARLTCAAHDDAIADLTCADADAALPARRAVAGRGGARLVWPASRPTRALNAFMPLEPERALAAAAAIGSALAARRAARCRSTACRRPSRTISGPRAADPARLANQRPRAGAGRCAGGRAAARAGRGHPRQDLHARARLDRRLPSPAHRHHAQSVESRSHARRLDRRRRGGGAARPRACCISAPTAPARCAFRRPLPACSA